MEKAYTPVDARKHRRIILSSVLFLAALVTGTLLCVSAACLSAMLHGFTQSHNTQNNPITAEHRLLNAFGLNRRADVSAIGPSNPAVGWHARAVQRALVYKGPLYEPKKEDLTLTVLFSTPAEPNGFTVALFKPSYAVDANGRILTMTTTEYDVFADLIKKVGALPTVDQWRVKHNTTSWPIDKLIIPGDDEVSVYGWSTETDVLVKPTKGYKRLPPSLNTLIGLAREGREDYSPDLRMDENIKKVLSFTY
ncbi:SubName: Full=Uncharacterized protein {ECO:0000313/EMBL:CCA74561.1} [Serendipita indica DSM 11827]|uniref:Uncharacterized protein n=1 Tax=Serendipita indica (strain DSM 11827) TaxID=1109443 RepID=G4TTB8_SERID|nr:SubName: Full=Uncharacterized protein {ECO:0000313/EMBL:CCA74561.1} [Serendipita indica DSM 11827]CCA74561.1 hypothetical protein PIIN_08513 [Serendipita indica DSM 11827]